MFSKNNSVTISLRNYERVSSGKIKFTTFCLDFLKIEINKQLTVGRRRPSGPPLPAVRFLYRECQTECDIIIFSRTPLLRNPYYHTYSFKNSSYKRKNKSVERIKPVRFTIRHR